MIRGRLSLGEGPQSRPPRIKQPARVDEVSTKTRRWNIDMTGKETTTAQVLFELLVIHAVRIHR